MTSFGCLWSLLAAFDPFCCPLFSVAAFYSLWLPLISLRLPVISFGCLWSLLAAFYLLLLPVIPFGVRDPFWRSWSSWSLLAVLLFSHDNRRIRIHTSNQIRKAKKHVDSVDPDPQHCLEYFMSTWIRIQHTLTPSKIPEFYKQLPVVKSQKLSSFAAETVTGKYMLSVRNERKPFEYPYTCCRACSPHCQCADTGTSPAVVRRRSENMWRVLIQCCGSGSGFATRIQI